jgi:hypothetical protein
MFNLEEIFLKFEEKLYSLAALPSNYVLVRHHGPWLGGKDSWPPTLQGNGGGNDNKLTEKCPR